LLLAALLCAFPLRGDDQPGADLANLNLEQLMKVQFYTASKHAQDASETPASVTIVTRDDIRTYGYRTLADVLSGVRGFWVNSDRDYSYVGVLGFARPGDFNTRILLLVNGHRLNDNIFGQASVGTEFPMDVDLIERIEILRGPSSSLYGTDAFLAVINVITRKSPLAPMVETSVEGGTGYDRKARVTLGLPALLDGALVSATVYRSNGNESLYFPEFDSPATNYGLAQHADGDCSGSGFASVDWRHFQFQALAGSRTKLVPTAPYDTIFDDSGTRTTDAAGFAELAYRRDLAAGLQLTSRWFYDDYEFHGSYPVAYDGVRQVGDESSRGDATGTEFNLAVPLGHHQMLTVGSEFRYNLQQRQRLHLDGDPVMLVNDERTSDIFAVYLQDEVKISSWFSMNAGLRLDRYSTFGSAVSPRAAVILRPNPKTDIKYMFGRAFRAPTAFEAYYADGVTQEINPALRPETVTSHGVSVERMLTPSFSVAVEGFHNQMNQLINLRIDPATGLGEYVNLSSDGTEGLEFQLDARHSRLGAALSYTLQRSTDSLTGTALANSPKHLAKSKVQAPVRSMFLMSLELQYESPESTYTQFRIPDSLDANATVSTRKPIWGFDLSASCYNLLDRRNYDPVSPWLREQRLEQNGREFLVRITRTFSRR
jgi:iron complex outermembrane receptor protein